LVVKTIEAMKTKGFSFDSKTGTVKAKTRARLGTNLLQFCYYQITRGKKRGEWWERVTKTRKRALNQSKGLRLKERERERISNSDGTLHGYLKPHTP
jgi:hypothetical protein